MKINHSIEQEDGTVVFQGVLEGRELDFVIEVGINTLFQQGALPFLSALKTPAASRMKGSATSQ